jgi:hypothetical protein
MGNKHMEIRVIDMVSLSSDGVKNEDKAGIRMSGLTGSAWVIDGASGINGNRHISKSTSDATWYAQQLNRIFYGLEIGIDAEQTTRIAIQKIAALYANEISDRKEIPEFELPSAAVFWVRWFKNRVESSSYAIDMGWLGDCVSIIENEDEISVYGNELTGFTNDEIASLLRNVKKQNSDNPDVGKALISQAIVEERKYMNKDHGYWIFSTDVRAADKLFRKKLSLDHPATILLATDGFYRIVDLFTQYTPRQIIQIGKEQGINYLLRELRNIEEQDCYCEKYLRFKKSDDATALLFELLPG